MEDNVKWEEFVQEHKIDIDELPENVQHKIEVFEDKYAEYEAADDEDENLISDLELALTTMDNGILSELQSYVANKKDSKEQTPEPSKAENGGQTPPNPEPPKHQASDKPSWAFWM
jgi:hypothetical protein